MSSNKPFSEAATRGALWKKVFLEISQNSQENTCARVFFSIKMQVWGFLASQSVSSHEKDDLNRVNNRPKP